MDLFVIDQNPKWPPFCNVKNWGLHKIINRKCDTWSILFIKVRNRTEMSKSIFNTLFKVKNAISRSNILFEGQICQFFYNNYGIKVIFQHKIHTNMLSYWETNWVSKLVDEK